MQKRIQTVIFFLFWMLPVQSQTGFFQADSYFSGREKVIASYTKKGKTVEVVQTPEGRIIKRVQGKNIPIRKKGIEPWPVSSVPVFRADEIPFTLFESFENWDETQSWLPENWTWESKTGIGRDNPNYITWFTSASFTGVRPSDGKYFEWINMDVNFEEKQRQDEWLISPPVVPQTNDTLFFDANFNPFWMLFNMESFAIDFENPASLLQAMISIDDGKNWISLWKAIDAYKGYSEAELEYFLYQDPEWHEIKVSLKDYAGKTVKIAFRYEGLWGDSNGLDRISVSRERPFSPKEPAASYAIPPGFLLGGLSPAGEGLPGVMLAPAYLPVTWRNTSFDAKNYHWIMPNIYDMGTYTSSEENPSARYIHDGYYFPVLTVNWEDKVSEPYAWEIEARNLPYEKAVFFAGGSLAEHTDIKGLGVANFNLVNNITAYRFNPDDYLFGTRQDNSTDGVANAFDKPAQPYVLNGIHIATANFKAPAGTELNLFVHRVVDDRMLDTIATAKWKTDTLVDKPDFYNLAFTGFSLHDSHSQVNELLIEDAILVELTGFNNKPGVSLACFSEFLHANEEENHAYLFTVAGGERVLLEPSQVLTEKAYTSLCFSLDMIYSFIGPENLDYLFLCDPDGGQKTFDMAGYYPSGQWSVVSELPGWLTLDITQDNDAPKLRFTAGEMPEGFERRYVDVVISDNKGGTCIFEVVQDLFSGIHSLKTSHRVKVLDRGDFLELIYPGEIFDSVSLYAVSGRKIATYPLSAGGKFDLPASSMVRGVYILKLSGKTIETIKIIR
jgi:hypothetical protein